MNCFKACLIAQGFKQQAELNFNETFSSIVKPTTIRVVFSIAISLGWPKRQLDFKKAFLHDILCEKIYICQPPDFSHPKFLNHMCRLQKAIYDLKKAPLA